jgi:hypothetical protein
LHRAVKRVGTFAAGVVMVAACGSATPSAAEAPAAPVEILTGRADAEEGAISIETGDWTYNVPLDVMWMDTLGSWHESGRPECLTPGVSRQIRFAAVEVTIEDSTWRPVVWVDCRP